MNYFAENVAILVYSHYIEDSNEQLPVYKDLVLFYYPPTHLKLLLLNLQS